MMTSSLEIMKQHYRQRDLAARQWKDNGGKVVGYVYNSVPEELITAAGMLPIQITGDPEIGTEVGDEYMEYYFCPFVRSVHDLFLRGKYKDLDLAILPNVNDSIKRCYFYFLTEKELEPGLPIPPLSMFDVLHTRRHIATRYVHGRIIALKEELEALSGKKISDEALASAIEVHNENRRLLRQVMELRYADPPRISGVDSLQIIGSSFSMPKEEHNKLLKDFLGQKEKLEPVSGTRLFVSGTIIDNLQLYELLESCGGVVVSEDVCTGARYTDNLVDTKMDPIEALTERYQTKAHDGRMTPLSEMVDYLMKGVRASKAQGTVFYYLQWDDSHGWNYPSQRNALNEEGIANIAFDMQEYTLSGQEQIRNRMQAFLEMING